ncbi:MAG: tRNA pseudouridine(38-40) synthase TruA [Myxococcota bacterium]|jgi:tRNA pseudouridine38-40 synthase|nr:tRNA pseudouridine(38-40) synthase TruA [Myxococcota bacterium]
MRHFRLVLEYDGAGFEGWQIQPGETRTVQGALVQAAEKLAGGGEVVVRGSGRTDSGVHAAGQVASVALETDLDAEALLRALNGNLPRDVVIHELEACDEAFDPRRQAKTKSYAYAVWNGALRSPLRAARYVHVPAPLDLPAMREAAFILKGEHDFASFQAAGSDVENTVRTLHRIAISGDSGGEVFFEFEGSGFLRHMVRNLVGTLLEVGQGRREPGSMTGLLEARDRGLAGPTAPAHGLTLAWVEYPENDPGETPGK